MTFNDGTSESFDLLIGADGVHSATRALVFGADEQFSHDLGYTIACYPLADRYGIGSTWKMYVEPGRLAATYCTRQAGSLLTFFMFQSAGCKQLPPREQRLAHVREVFAGMGWITRQLVADAPPSTPVFMDALVQIQMPTWHHGRVALVGDACGCPTLLLGQGASLAMAGAYLLAEALHESASLSGSVPAVRTADATARASAAKAGPRLRRLLPAWHTPGPVCATDAGESCVPGGVS